MKRTLFILLTGLFALNSLAQDESADTTLGWTYPTVINFTLSQVYFSDSWAAGGESSYSINGLATLEADYKGLKAIWENSLIIAYGVMKQGTNELRKTDDNLEFSSKFGYKTANKNWYYSALLQFKSQFAEGFKYDDVADTKTKLSQFMAPAYLNLSLGINYAPSKVFSLFIGPLSGRATFVMDDSLSVAGAYGVGPGENIRKEFGGTVRAVLNMDIMKNVNMFTKLELFSNYVEKPQNIDVDWQLLLTMKVNKWLSANINLHLIYDDDIKTVKNNNEIGGPEVQFKEVFGIGFNYKF